MLCKKVKFEEINPAPYNPKKDLQPGDPEYEKIKASIERFEMSEALVWNKRTGNLIDGHQRLKILKEKGHKEEWCVIKDLSLEEEKALNLALFELKGDYDMTKLAEVLNSLDEDLLQYTGFTMDRVHEIVLDHLPKVDDEPFKPEGGKRGGGDRLKVDWDGFSIWHAEIMAFMYATPTASYLASYTVMDGKDLPQKGPGNRLFVDSGFLAGYRKQGLPYLERQGEIIDYARRNEADWVAMMDIPLVEPILKKLEISREKAYEIHLDKAREFYHASTGEMNKVYVLQSRDGTISGFSECLDEFSKYLDDRDVIAIGGIAGKHKNEQLTLLPEVVRQTRERFLPNQIHIFGVTKPNLLAYLSTVGATSCDSSYGSIAGFRGDFLLPVKHEMGYAVQSMSLDKLIDHEYVSYGSRFLWGCHIFSTGAVEFAVRLAIKEWITNNYGADQVLSSKDTGGEEE